MVDRVIDDTNKKVVGVQTRSHFLAVTLDPKIIYALEDSIGNANEVLVLRIGGDIVIHVIHIARVGLPI
jgi:hypothetical protein